jgi:hypothetical protein
MARRPRIEFEGVWVERERDCGILGEASGCGDGIFERKQNLQDRMERIILLLNGVRTILFTNFATLRPPPASANLFSTRIRSR